MNLYHDWAKVAQGCSAVISSVHFQLCLVYHVLVLQDDATVRFFFVQLRKIGKFSKFLCIRRERG
jgi:hypothetical protein